MAMGNLNGLMEGSIKDNIGMIKNMGMDVLSGLMARFIVVSGLMGNSMVKEYI